MQAEHAPVVNGLRLGSLVELHSLTKPILCESGKQLDNLNGEYGQLAKYQDGRFFLYLMNGESCYVDPANVRIPSDLEKPGEDKDGRTDGFDLLMTPMTSLEAVGKEVSACLFEKGFCILKVAQDPKLVESALECLSRMGNDGDLSRLPEEIEDGYLGSECNGKVAWMERQDSALSAEPFLVESDANLTNIAQAITPYSCDALGSQVEERSPTLVCLTLSQDEIPEYPSPMADDKTLGDFLSTWRRSLVRVVHFMGPGTPRISLRSKRNDAARALPTLLDHGVTIHASPNTILLFRPDCFEYGCLAREESLMLISNLLSPAPNLVLAHVEGDVSVLTSEFEGPRGPSGTDNIDVVNIVARLPANLDSDYCYSTAAYGGVDGVVRIPQARWDVDLYLAPNTDIPEPWQTTTQHQSYVEGVTHFDNRYFEISNAESLSMDPVQRIVLETGAMSLAKIGLSKKESNKKSTHASFSVGNDKLDWHDVVKDHTLGNFQGAANVLAIIANRFSFVFNMKGPNFVCDTACSASLVATHLAKLMLRARDYDPLEFHISLGSHLVLAAGPFIGCSQSRMSSIGGRCFTFNNSADGYLRGEGSSGVMLKFGNMVDEREAVLRATQAGQDGRSASMTAPNGPAQEDVIVKSMREAKLSATESTFWECHGTGTSLGDPIEVGACRKTQIKEPRTTVLGLAAHKTNLGHLEGGAGMAGIVKSVIQVKHSSIAPSNHLRVLNPHLEHTQFPAFYSSEIERSKYNQVVQHVSSFGFGGTNAHGIFWGVNRVDTVKPPEALFQQKMLRVPPPEVRPTGTSPDEWESDWPDIRAVKKGAKWAISFAANDASDASLKYILADDGLEDMEEIDDHFYSITGNFNDWESDRLVAGDVPGLWVAEVEIPSSGELTFHFLQDGLYEQALCPQSPQCMRKTETIIGPIADGPVNSWLIRGTPHQDVQIELFVLNGVRTLLWIKR